MQKWVQMKWGWCFLLTQVRGIQHQPKARKQDISAARALPVPSANYFPIHLHPNSIHTEPALNQCHSFCQFCPEENYPSCMTVDSCNNKNKKKFVIWQQLRSPLVLRGRSLLVSPCHPGNPAVISSRLRLLVTLTGHTCSLLQFQCRPLGLVVQVSHRGLSLLSCPVTETNNSVWNILDPSEMSFNIHMFCIVSCKH